jgi:Protein of unknown function (DUF3592)
LDLIRRKWLYLLLIFIPLALWYPFSQDAIDEYRIAREGEIANGVITQANEEPQEGTTGHIVGWTSYITYQFITPEGQTVTGYSTIDSQLKSEVYSQLGSYPIKVRYFPSNPQRNVIAEAGQRSFWHIFRDGGVLIAILLVVIFVPMGVYYGFIRKGSTA